MGGKNMFTYEDFKSLSGITDRDELMSAVAQIPEEDLRTALFITLLSWGKNIEINEELWKREHERANKAEAMLNSQPSENDTIPRSRHFQKKSNKKRGNRKGIPSGFLFLCCQRSVSFFFPASCGSRPKIISTLCFAAW